MSNCRPINKIRNRKYDSIIRSDHHRLRPRRAGSSCIRAESTAEHIDFGKAMVSGGQVLTTYEVDNYPGLPGIGGYDLGLKFREHADRLGALFKEDEVISVEDGPVKRVVCSGGIYEARAVILATGAIHRKLGIPGEEELGGAGVSYCATCDGAFSAIR